MFPAEGVHFKFSGTTGHGSLLLQNAVGDKIQYIITKMTEFRSNEVAKLANNPRLAIGDVTTVNLTMLSGGLQSNIVPPEATLVFDIRLGIDVDHQAFEEQVMSTVQCSLVAVGRSRKY